MTLEFNDVLFALFSEAIDACNGIEGARALRDVHTKLHADFTLKELYAEFRVSLEQLALLRDDSLSGRFDMTYDQFVQQLYASDLNQRLNSLGWVVESVGSSRKIHSNHYRLVKISLPTDSGIS